MPRIAINELTTYRWTFDDDVFRVRQAGFDGIGVWRPKLSDFGEERGVDLLQESGLVVSSLHWAGGFTGCDGRSYREGVHDALAAIRLARDLDTKTLFVHGGARAGHTQNHARRLFTSALKEILPLAEEHGIRLAIEPMHRRFAAEWNCVKEFDEILDLIGSLDSNALALAFDCYHVLHDPAILDRVATIADRIAIVQLGDANCEPGEEQDRCLLGEGYLPLSAAVSALKTAGYDGFFEVELLGEDMEFCDYDHILRHSKQAAESLLNIYAAT